MSIAAGVATMIADADSDANSGGGGAPSLQIDFARSPCPIATTLDLVGDRWSLVIVRDLLNGKARFGELAGSPERIPTNILSDRLRRLEATGLIAKAPYQTRPLRNAYRLTPAGRALAPVLQAICRWANSYIDGTWTPPAEFMAPIAAKDG